MLVFRKRENNSQPHDNRSHKRGKKELRETGSWLPSDPVRRIFNFLPPNMRPSLCLVSRMWNRVGKETIYQLARRVNDRLFVVRDEMLPSFPALKRLSIMGRMGVTEMGIINHAQCLTKLALYGVTNVTDHTLKFLPRLTELTISGTSISDQGLVNVPQLTSLNLGILSSTITDAGLAHLSNLTSLTLAWNRLITNAGLAHVTGLTSLGLCNNYQIDDDGLRHLPNLTSLDLTNNSKVTNAGMAHVPKLVTLVLDGPDSEVTGEGLAYLSRLASLSLVHNYDVTNDALLQVSTLTFLDISDNRLITDEGIRHLSRLTRLVQNGDTLRQRQQQLPCEGPSINELLKLCY